MNIQLPTFKQILLVLTPVLLIALFIYIYLPGHSRYHELKRKEEELDKKIQYLTEQIEEMREEKHLLENDVQYLEKVVRENLGRVEPGETVYKIVDEPVESS